ncbi:MAG: hypothetical protein EXQ86_00210 [Rhodospirillales bacterium]|nr:hypothetical protein [Rhodospirillales bacterium]
MAEASAINPSLIQILRPVQTAQQVIEARQQQDALERTADETRKEAGVLDQVRRFEDQRLFVEQVRADEFGEDRRKLANAQEFADQLIADRRRLITSQQLTDFQRLQDQQVAAASALRDSETARIQAAQAIEDSRVERAERRAQEVREVAERRDFVRDTSAAEPSAADLETEAAALADEGDFEEIVFSPQAAVAAAQTLPPPPVQPLSPAPELAAEPEASSADDARTVNAERARADAEQDLRTREDEVLDLARQQLASASFNPARSRGAIVDLVG